MPRPAHIYQRNEPVTGATSGTYDACVVCVNDDQNREGGSSGRGRRIQARIEGHMDNLSKIPDGPTGGMPWWPVAHSNDQGGGKGNHRNHNLTPGDMVRVQLDGPHGTVLYPISNDQEDETHHPAIRGKDGTVSYEDVQNGTYGYPMRYDEVMKNKKTQVARDVLRPHKLYSRYNEKYYDKAHKKAQSSSANKKEKSKWPPQGV